MDPTDENLKKLLMRSVLRVDLEEETKPEKPMTLKEEKAVLNRFSEKDFPDTFHLAIVKEKNEPGKLFSQSALERFLHILRLYVGGRILGNFDKTQQSPEVVCVHIKIEHLTREAYEKLMKEDS